MSKPRIQIRGFVFAVISLCQNWYILSVDDAGPQIQTEASYLDRRFVENAPVLSGRCAGRDWVPLFQAQTGEKHIKAKPLKGIGPGVLEVVSDHRGDTFRAIYTVQLADKVYVLHAFQKKSKSGIATPKAEMDLVKQRLRRAIELHASQERYHD